MPFFVVQEHHSRSLHYDLRLEIDGVLKSWAVPKGPSMAPADRRLAIMVDDHPIEYGTFEGTIPEGYYGAGAVLIWDRGDLDLVAGDVAGGSMEFILGGGKLKGAFVLKRLKGKDRQWLLIKKKDDQAQPAFNIKPLLGEKERKTLQERVPPCNLEE